MRNYIAFSKQDFDIFDGSDPMNPILIGALLHVEDDEEDSAAFAATLPPSGNTFYVPQGAPYPYWPLLDKGTIKEVLNGASPGSFNHWQALQADNGSPEFDKDWPTSDGDLGRERQNIGKTGKTKTIDPETLLQALITFAGALVAEGYKTGGRPNLLTRLIVFITAVKNNQPYDAVALGVLLSQIESLAHFAG